MKRLIITLAFSVCTITFNELRSMDLALRGLTYTLARLETSHQKNPSAALLEIIGNPTNDSIKQSDEIIAKMSTSDDKNQVMYDLITAYNDAKEKEQLLRIEEMKTRTGNFRLRKICGGICIAGGTVASTIPLNMLRKMICSLIPSNLDNVTTVATWGGISVATLLFARQQFLYKQHNQKLKGQINLNTSLSLQLRQAQKAFLEKNPDLQTIFPEIYNKVKKDLPVESERRE